MTAIRRQYFNIKVWVRDRIVSIAYLYLAGVFLYIISLSIFYATVETAFLAVAPLILVVVLAATNPAERES